jgi:hypothetical protein
MRAGQVRVLSSAVVLGAFALAGCSSSSTEAAGPGEEEGGAAAPGECSSGACADAGPATEVDAADPDAGCGAGTGQSCAPGATCVTSADCEGACVAGICGPVGDTDGKKNNGETDVDCGGPNAKKCATGKACATGPDCGFGYCPATTCVAPTSTDSVQNGTESDVDCGGDAQAYAGATVPAAPKCELTKSCASDTDCESAVCSTSKRCVEGPSCRPLHGGSTCGAGEVGAAGAAHESCCKSLPVPGLTMTQGGVEKQVYLDKYEITAGRVRAWVEAIKAQYGGVPNIQAWVKARMAVDPILAAMFPADKADYLPAQATNQQMTLTNGANSGDFDMGLLSQLGPTSYYRGVLGTGGTSGCALYANAYGHRTYWFDATESAYFSELVRPAAQKDWLDEKSMNCITPIMFTAFCAWDGGYVQSQAAISTAYGPDTWPWGATPDVTDTVAKITNYNAGTSGFGNAKDPRYLFPVVGYASFASDLSPIIAAPGRFPTDASQVLAAADTWMDLGGNLIEWSQVNGTWRGWTGSSFEGHRYPRAWTGNIQYLDKYGKGGSRCMRLR